ncbi:ATP-binding protein [Acanthopleuribacter pedis]|uniref:histidine kinase n=1 Tax=Acanthopleuribacter pedis TaxID=442870 RepID=A0A8J7U2N3_9BACT|nr:ATP-binding protein [Acanthopleuribacter pedis]MBO1317443.1 PAS domain S-box protein [Acanthopleuribacter pedis]
MKKVQQGDTFSKVRFQKIPRHFTLTIVLLCFSPLLALLMGLPLSTTTPPPTWSALLAEDNPAWRLPLLTHTLLTWSAFCIALCTAVFAAVHYLLKRDVAVLIISIALFCSGCLDAYHVMAANSVIGSNADPNTLIPLSWLASRVFNGGILISGCWFLTLGKRDPKSDLKKATLFAAAFGALTLITVLVLPLISLNPFQGGSVVKQPGDLLPLALYFVAAIWVFPHFHRQYPNLFAYSLLVSVVPNIVVHLHMALGSTAPLDGHFQSAQVLRVVAYTVPFLGLCLDYINTHRNLKYELKQRGQKARLMQDIREREEAERRIHEEKERLRVTLACIGDGVIATDTEGNIQLINEVGARLTGRTIEDATGRPLEEVLTLLDAQTHNPHQPNHEDSGSERIFPVLLVSTDGTEHMVAERTTPILDAAGEILGFVLVIRDITSQEKARSRMAQSQKMESIGQLAAGIAHEINSPMQFVGDNNEFLTEAFTDYHKLFEELRQLIDQVNFGETKADQARQLMKAVEKELDIAYLEDEIPKALRQSREGIDRVSQLVRAMKAFSHPDRGNKTMSDLNEAIRNTITISHNEWKYVADLEAELGESVGLVHCQISLINQAVLNLLVNAGQAIGEQVKSGRFKKGLIKVSTERRKSGILIQIEDNGGGIPPSIRHRIFDPFFTTKEIGTGSGQGLAITHDIIVNKHRGKIEVDSKAGEGTVFSIALPDPQSSTEVTS